MSWTVQYFGEKIMTKNGVASTEETLKGKKRIGIYFSAHWCPPCRQFTPVLGEFYNHAKQIDPNGLEIIFISADSDEGSYQQYYNSMPFLSTIYGCDQNEELNGRFGVNGIPTLIILDGTNGQIRDKQARNTVTTHRGSVEQCFQAWGIN